MGKNLLLDFMKYPLKAGSGAQWVWRGKAKLPALITAL